MLEGFYKILDYLLANYALYLVVTMGIIISLTILLINLLKKPIKKFITSKIKNDKVQKLVNKVFIIFAFGISALAWFTLSKLLNQYFKFEPIIVLLTGALSIVIYELGNLSGSKTKKILDTALKIIEDNKIDENDNSALKELYNALGQNEDSNK